MYRKVIAYIKENKMIQAGDMVIAGVSGGGDSMAMLHILKEWKKECPFDLTVVHVHHGIRGEEAERDWRLVEETCKSWEIPCAIYRYQVPLISKEQKIGEEEAGRMVRRMAFAEEERRLFKEGVSVKVALAHNKNDLAETMLHNLARGTGLRGLSGIGAVKEKIIRPLLCLERREIDDYLKVNKIPYVTDSTNLEDEYTRNRIRHHVLPVLEEEINGQAVSHMAEAAEKIALADAFLQKCAVEIVESCKKNVDKFLLTEDFCGKEKIIQSYVIMEMFERLAGKRKDFSRVHVEQVLGLMESQTGRFVQLPYGLLARKTYQGIELGKDVEEEKKQTMEADDFQMKIFPYEDQKICEKKYTKWFDYDKIQEDLSVRCRQAGDYMIIDKEGRKKKLTRYMIDEKIPKDCRDSLLLLAKGSEVIWVPGGRIGENYKVTRETKRILEIKYQGGHEDERND